MSQAEFAIEARGLSKEYQVSRSLVQCIRDPFGKPKRFRALDNLHFQTQYGQVVALVGLNGAGKTTLLKLLCDLLSPTMGHVAIAGHALPAEGMHARAVIGYVPSDERSFFWRISGRANLEFFASLFCIPRKNTLRKIDELLELFGLARKADMPVRDYSSGMRKRLAMIRGLLHSPRILLLDEPTNSLDPYWSHFLGVYVREWVNERPGRSVVWSTHRTEEIKKVCDTALRLDRGRLSQNEDLDLVLSHLNTFESEAMPR